MTLISGVQRTQKEELAPRDLLFPNPLSTCRVIYLNPIEDSQPPAAIYELLYV